MPEMTREMTNRAEPTSQANSEAGELDDEATARDDGRDAGDETVKRGGHRRAKQATPPAEMMSEMMGNEAATIPQPGDITGHRND